MRGLFFCFLTVAVKTISPMNENRKLSVMDNALCPKRNDVSISPSSSPSSRRLKSRVRRNLAFLFFLKKKTDVMHMVIVMEHDAWETQEWMKPKYASPVACLAKTSELIRSLRDDEQVKSQEPGCASGCAFTMRANGRS